MKKMKYLSIILLVLLIAFPVFGRDFGQAKNNFTGIQYFEAGVIFGTKSDSLDTIVAVSNDPLMADADSASLVTEYAAKGYVDDKVPYLSYRFFFTQTDTSEPQIIVFENTFSDTISWTREGTGEYRAEFPDSLCYTNTFINIGNMAGSIFWNEGEEAQIIVSYSFNSGDLIIYCSDITLVKRDWIGQAVFEVLYYP